ncbi:MAG: outer membrane protein transport protein [Myxococcota bacterium]
MRWTRFIYPRTAWLGAALALVAPASVAHASGLLVARFGGEWGNPMTDHLAALYYNPAGLALLDGTQLQLDGSFALRSFTYDRDPGAIDNIITGDPSVGAGTPDGEGVAANSGKASLTNFLVTPFFAVGSDFGIPGFGAALGLYVPIGGQTVFDKADASNTFPGAVDGPARWWTIEGTARSIYGSAAAAYRIPSLRLSIGVALDLVYSQIDNVQARNTDGTDHLVVNGNLQEGRVRIDVSSIDVGLGVGLMYEPIENLFVGLSYRSQPNFGEQRLTGDTQLLLGGGPAADDLSTPSEVRQQMPDVVRFGVRYTQPKAWEVRVFGDWARWSVLDKQCVLNATVADRSCKGDFPPGKILIIPRAWHDGWEVRAGGSYWLSPGAELAFGAGYDSNAVPDKAIEPAFYDTEKMTLSLGLRLDLTDALNLEATYTQVIYFDRTVAPRGRVPVDAADPHGATKTDLSGTGFPESWRVPDSAGTYRQAIGLLEVGLTYKF